MKNTGLEYASAERTPTVLAEMAELLPPLGGEQLAALEQDLLRNGCYSPIIVNEDLVIVDGHNRQSPVSYTHLIRATNPQAAIPPVTLTRAALPTPIPMIPTSVITTGSWGRRPTRTPASKSR